MQAEEPSIGPLLAGRGLVVSEMNEDGTIWIVRPSSVAGTAFPDFPEDSCVGIGNVSLLTNAPFAAIRRKRRPIRWVAEITIACAGGPIAELVYFRETFESAHDAATAIIECFFGNRIDFNRH